LAAGLAQNFLLRKIDNVISQVTFAAGGVSLLRFFFPCFVFNKVIPIDFRPRESKRDRITAIRRNPAVNDAKLV
jgi:hypothetical protein